MISTLLSQSEQEKLIRKLEIFKIQGRDKRGRPILRVIGKLFPGNAIARLVTVDTVKKYLEDEIFPSLDGRPFSVVYVHTGVVWEGELCKQVGILVDRVRRRGIEMPEFVHEFEEEMECRPTMDYGLESDHPGIIHGGPCLDSTVSTYSMRCIA
ncbi:hypothetical protein DH2020_007448 [Rehmannia glutinosa]|uniref:CRAL-TRIO domain-containing protein n=1 Tax=Rehmannia glutinosa TaxID=99300 RepID=A0ABR0TY63_REHGL